MCSIFTISHPGEKYKPPAPRDFSLSRSGMYAIGGKQKGGILCDLCAFRGAGSFLPDNTITRKKAAAIITRLADPALRQDITLL